MIYGKLIVDNFAGGGGGRYLWMMEIFVFAF